MTAVQFGRRSTDEAIEEFILHVLELNDGTSTGWNPACLMSREACLQIITRQETAEDGMVGLQSKFQNLNTKVNQNVDRWTDIWTDIIDP